MANMSFVAKKCFLFLLWVFVGMALILNYIICIHSFTFVVCSIFITLSYLDG